MKEAPSLAVTLNLWEQDIDFHSSRKDLLQENTWQITNKILCKELEESCLGELLCEKQISVFGLIKASQNLHLGVLLERSLTFSNYFPPTYVLQYLLLGVILLMVLKCNYCICILYSFQ